MSNWNYSNEWVWSARHTYVSEAIGHVVRKLKLEYNVKNVK